ncbi:LUD domain-containing protein [Streptomyces sp. SR27]|uniref:LutC/YkgG family protein n=1 Tax=Streptomyces sp. SR27 TaxID=3076630 RepID=UPI00295BEEE1|nr:LUD domain-containing protein [Streptomyces sp. SR27]MDV9193586.1 LUD domain-containing protein [Streptomyces sp. SR27]
MTDERTDRPRPGTSPAEDDRHDRTDTGRAAVLGRIRAALGDVPADETPADVPVPRAYLRTTPPDDIVTLFAERVADYRATVVRCAPEEVARTVAALLERRGVRRVVVPDGFPPEFLTRTDADLVRDAPPLTVRQLDAVDSTLTTVAVAIAETGTVVLDAGPGQGRRALTLVPDHHLCVVHPEQIVPDVPEALARLDPRRPLTLVSGPSATSDIELRRVEGVHGPRILDIVLVTSGTPARPETPETSETPETPESPETPDTPGART